MGSKDPKPEPSLELPSFSLGRKKKRAPKTEESAPTEDTQVIEPEPAPVAEPAPEPAVTPEPTTPEPTTPEATVTEPSPDQVPVAAPRRKTPRRKTSRPRRRRTEAEGAPATGVSDDTAALEPTASAPASAMSTTASAPEPPAAEPKPRRELSLPALPGLTAALVTGVVVGLLAVLLTGLSLRLCELVQSTPSCGGPGFFLLVAILILLTYIGGWLLRGWRVPDPMSTSFLAVGLLAVIAMLFFIDALFSPWMLLVIPVVAAATYALSWWVTTTFVDVEDDDFHR